LVFPLEETSARQLFLVTSAAYKANIGAESGIPIFPGLAVHLSVDGIEGSSV
jgi:hypothetical protein